MQYDQEGQNYLMQMQNELEQERSKNFNLNKDYGQSSMFIGSKPQDIAQWQLDLREELDRLYHILCGHVIKHDGDGNSYWGEPDTYLSKSLTKYGVDQCMSIISNYLNRNTILSYYDSLEFINDKMKDLADEINDKFLFEYEYMFYAPTLEELYSRDITIISAMRVKYKDNERGLEKAESELAKKHKEERNYVLKKSLNNMPLLHRMIVDTIHSAYLRGYRGEERSSLRKIMHISQATSHFGSGTQNNPQMLGNGGKPMSRSLLHPSTWFH